MDTSKTRRGTRNDDENHEQLSLYLQGKIPRKKFISLVGEETFQRVWQELANGIRKQARKKIVVNGSDVNEEEIVPAMGIANSFIIWNFHLSLAAGPTIWVGKLHNNVWLFPIVLTSPGYGVVGKVGRIAVDMNTRQIIGCTDRNLVLQRSKRLSKRYKAELKTAFLKTRTA